MVRMDKEIPYERRMERVDEVLTGVSTTWGIVSWDEYIFFFCSGFKVDACDFIIIFLFHKAAWKFKNHQHMSRKWTDLNF